MEDTTTLNFYEYYNKLKKPKKEITSATNNFADENLIAQGSFAKVYKGRLLLQSGEWINIVVRKLLQPNLDFIDELTIFKNIKHKNILSLFGYAKSDGEISFSMLHEHQVNQSLDKHLSGSTLTWMQRLQICVGVANALCYLHYGSEDYSVIHCNIKSSKILLNHDWEPKLHDFRCAMKLEGKRHGLYLTRKYKGTLQYMDPTFESTQGLTLKSDVFSFGVVLFEVLFGMKASVEDNDNWYFARLARRCYEEKRLDDMIDPDLRKQMDIESLNIFSKTAYYCLMEQREKRPDIEHIVRKLERALQFQQKHQTLGRNIDHLRIRLVDIKVATNNFSETFCIGSGGYGMVYKAELDHFDGMSPLASELEGKNEDELPKRHRTVAIKRISNRVDRQGEQGFIIEIEMLSKCKHSNIVSLLGFCDEDSEMILVYEYAPRGSLDNYLENINSMTHLTWAQRIQICLDIAHGLEYLHTSTQDKEIIVHRDLKSANILLDDHWVAKIADFGLSKSHHAHEPGSTFVTNHIAGTEVYIDPVYQKTGKLKKESDIYSLGVVFFEIMYGRLAYDKTFNQMGLPFVARQCFEKGTLNELVDPKLKEVDENILKLNEGVKQLSLDTFSNIAYQCLASSQSERPMTEVIIKELEKALNFQKINKDDLHISLDDIKLATQNFNDEKCIGEGEYWKEYEGDLSLANVNNNGYAAIIAKRFDSKFPEARHEFFTELKILYKYSKHENIVSLVGYCNEMDETIIVYEHALNGQVDKLLDNASLTWMRRLKICIDVACGLNFLHTEGVRVGNIKTSSILLDGEWKAKIFNLELSMHLSEIKEIEHLTEFSAYFPDDCDRDIHPLGKILLDILIGRLCTSNDTWLFEPLIGSDKHHQGLVFQGIKEQIDPKSLTIFLNITRQCLQSLYFSCPTAREVVSQLKKALEFQEDHEIWKPRLPIDYKEIIQMSKDPETYLSLEMNKELYVKLSEGILLQDGKVWFSLGSNRARNEMISARKFSYKNCRSRKWRSVRESRFKKVAKMLDLSKLKMEIKITTQFLSLDVKYGVYLIFKFCDTREISSKQMYVNLNYKMGGENMHAYFATWRNENWMTIELCRFLNTKRDTNFEVLLESFSRYYCGSNAMIYVEGIEFRALDNVKHEKSQKIEEVQQVPKSKSNKEHVQQFPSEYDEKLKRFENDSKAEKMSPNEVNGKKHFMLSAMDVLYDSSNVKRFHSEPAESRFQEVIELPPQQVFRIICKFQTQMLSQDTEYLCYLVFKLSRKCRGLHCPVKVRDLLHRNNKEAKVVYFRSPSPWNLHDIISVPIQREDGWTEVKVWKFVSKHDLCNDSTRVNLKFITYEGTMSGLIIGGLEFRSM